MIPPFAPAHFFSDKPGQVVILIGPNGSGKSRLLRRHCQYLLARKEDVIAIAPTVFDRFGGLKSSRFHFFGSRLGARAANLVIQEVLSRAYETPQLLKNVSTALEYTRFDPKIGLRVRGADPEKLEALPISGREMENLRDALRRISTAHEDDRGMIQFSLSSHSFAEFDQLSLAILARHAPRLRKIGAIASIEYFLHRKGEPIPLLNACSGELMHILTIAFIATHIRPSATITIDEPETSLHPGWQSEHVRTLLDLFSNYQPTIVISTHSPIIVSGAEAARAPMEVFEVRNGEIQPFAHQGLSLEEMYDRLFNLITPKNHHLSQEAVTLLNQLNAQQISLDVTLRKLDGLQDRSYDDDQKAVIEKVKRLAHEVANPTA